MSIFKSVHQTKINFRMLLRVMGWLLLMEAVYMFFPFLVSIGYGESDQFAFGISTGITALAGLLLTFRARPKSKHMGKREGFLLTALVWVVFSLFAQLPFLLCGRHISLSDAFFEAMSGFTTTGVSVIADPAGLSHTMHLWRAMMQWLGGAGIVLFTIAVIPMLNHAGGMQMFNAEVTGVTHDKIMPRISQTAKTLWGIYIVLTLLLTLLLWLGPMNLFDSICYAFGTISTGGYASSPGGIACWHDSVYVMLVLTAFMFLGGVNFGLIFRTFRGDFKALRKNDVFHVYMVAVAGMFVLFVCARLLGDSYTGLQSVTIDPLFQIVSIITSTGFVIPEYARPEAFVTVLILLMMFSGACAGSTSGGAKIDRVIFLYRNIRNELARCLFPNAILSVKVNGKVVNPELVTKVMVFLAMYVLMIIAGGAALAIFDIPLSSAIFSAFSCLSNTGIDASVIGGTITYAALPDVAKWILSLLMLIGRLEIFTVLVLFLPSFWRR